MDMLARYKKPGGFLQLLMLLESFGAPKREKFLEMIEAEDPTWANAIRRKFLSVERLFGWPEEAVATVLRDLPLRNFACALKGLSPEQTAIALKFLSHSERRKLDQEIAATDAKPEDIATSFHRIVELARKLVRDGEIRLEKIDEELLIPDGFEETLSRGGHSPAGPVSPVTATPAQEILRKKAESGELDSKIAGEILIMQKNLAAFAKENKLLRDEVKLLRDKLEAIRKIA